MWGLKESQVKGDLFVSDMSACYIEVGREGQIQRVRKRKIMA